MNKNSCNSATNMTENERFNMYMGLEKEILAKMLVEKDVIEKTEENIDLFPLDQRPTVCKTWEDCTNPYMDCVNCPLNHKNGDYSFVSDKETIIPPFSLDETWSIRPL